MAKLIMCLGLPGSGKSTWANASGAVVVNKDTIRRELEQLGWVWSREAEADVIKKRDELITTALQADKTVISDDTNLAPKHQNQLKALALKFRAKFEIKDFRDVDVTTCIERDSLRTGKAKVGRDVIVKMATTYLNYVEPIIKVVPYKPDFTKPRAIICDLDGTLAIHNGRSPYDTVKADTDLLNQPIYGILEKMYPFYKVIYCSGREDKFRDISQAWLKTHNCPPGPLFMRSSGDTRNDGIVKTELFNKFIRDEFNVSFVLDDRDRVVKAWRDLGLTCLQVAYGNF